MIGPGTRVGAYEIVAALGTGGMGEVYRARDPRLGRTVAIKLIADRLLSEPAARDRLQREARTIASLSHPNIVAVHDIGTHQGNTFVVMELVEGQTLERLLMTEKLSWRRALEIAAALAEGLASAHEHGVVHGDLKPANVLVTGAGAVKIVDFGLAGHPAGDAVDPPGATAPSLVAGTPGYISPEQINGQPADERADVFALGCVLYEMLAGRPPFPKAPLAESLASTLRDAPPELRTAGRNVPASVDAIARRCLEKRPDARYQSARDLAFSIRLALQAPGTPRWWRAPRWIAAAVVISIAAVLVQRSSTARRLGMPQASQPGAASPAPVSATASREAYMRGLRALDKRTEPDLREAISHFQASLDSDPTNALSYAGLAKAYGQLGYGSYVAPADAFPRSRAAAERALDIDPQLAAAHAALGYALMYYDWDFAGAEAEYRRAIALDARLPEAHQWYAYLMAATNKPFEVAEGEITAAQKLDPLSPAIETDRAYLAYYYGRYDQALTSVRATLDLNAKFPLAYFWLGRLYTSEGRFAEAERAFERIGPLRTWTPGMAALGYMYGKEGRRDQALAIVREFDDLKAQGRYASPYAYAAIYAGLGDQSRAFEYLDAAYADRSHWLLWLNRDPRWDEVRFDPRFLALVRRVGLPARPSVDAR